MSEKTVSEQQLFVAVDMGATKVQASTVTADGMVIRRLKNSTPRGMGPEPIIELIENSILGVIEKSGANGKQVAAIGLAIPGVVDPDAGRVVFTANSALSNVDIGPRLAKKFKIPVAIGNDCNLGAMGEKWLGSARDAQSVMAILVGTGIGGGFVQKARLWRGARESAGEIGHMVMQLGGPKCGCGNRGCFEALASRRAIERDIRQAVAAGRRSAVVELAGGDLSLIRSGVLRKALEAGDELVGEILARAAEVIGQACISIRHLIDPEVIVLGGGVIEACSDFMVPIVERVVASEGLPGVRAGGGVLVSALGDDAVVLGAVALARMQIGDNPFKASQRPYPDLEDLVLEGSSVRCCGKIFERDFYVTVNGKAKTQKSPLTVAVDGKMEISHRDLSRACDGGPEVLFIAAASGKETRLSPRAVRYLQQRNISAEILAAPEAVTAYNAAKRRKAALFSVEK